MKLAKPFIFLSMTALGVLLLAGCGQGPPPDPPKSRTDLVLDILEALERRDHKVALKKVERLRELDPTNVFLANLEILERNNSIIIEAQEEINKGDLSGALKKVNDGMKKHGRHKDLVTASKKLAVAARINEILEIFKDPKHSARLRTAALQLKEISTKYRPARPFLPLSEEMVLEAKRMDIWETKRGIETFCSYIDERIDQEDPDLKLLFAVLEVADPYNPTLLNYLDHLKGHEGLTLKTFDEENVFSSGFSEDDDMQDTIKVEVDPVVPGKATDDVEKVDTKKPEEKKKEEKKSWWNKFTF